MSWQWLSLKYSGTISSDYFAIGHLQELNASNNGASISRPKGSGTSYFDLSANFPVMDKLVINAHFGYTLYASDLRNASYTTTMDQGEAGTVTTTTNLGVPNYNDWKIGLTYDLGSGFSVAGAVVGASKKRLLRRHQQDARNHHAEQDDVSSAARRRSGASYPNHF